MSELDDKIARAQQAEAFDLQLVADEVSLEDLVAFAQDVMPGVPLSDVMVRLSPNDLGIRIEKRPPLDLWKYCGPQIL